MTRLRESKSFAEAIWHNRRRFKYKKLLSKLRLLWFDYEDAGKLQKLMRTIEKVRHAAGL